MIKYEQYIDLTNIKNSMQLDSSQIIAELQKDEMIVTLEVKGDISVSFDDKTYSSYDEFPDELKRLIESDSYLQDSRIRINSNNWFEFFIYKNPNDYFPKSYVTDAHNTTPEEVFQGMMKFTKGENP